VEVLSVEKEEELWELSFVDKMRLATERRQRGNTLVGGGHILMADAEYEQAMRYLIFMPHPELHEVPVINEALGAVNLNLSATKLRLGQEEAAIRHANDVLKAVPGDKAKVSKAHYRTAQAHTQLGKYAKARAHFDLAESAAKGDEASLGAIRKERERLDRREEKHGRDRRKALTRMGQSGGGEDTRGRWERWSSRLRKRLWPTSSVGQHALFTLAAALLVGVIAIFAQLTLTLTSALRSRPSPEIP
jgi:tetratricopeptide (TPR) repeat protein